MVLPPEELETAPLVPSEQFCRTFSLAEILAATNDFDESLIIGHGGFGKVYLGIINNGANDVAIKRLNFTSKQGDSEFRAEIELLSKFRHAHIVSLIGYCNDSSEKIIVYDYMINGSLADHLYKIGKIGKDLSWVQRLNICLGAARGLDYIHTCTNINGSVIHRDVKSSNILLDTNMSAKVSDFGLSRVSPISKSDTHISTNVKGTIGYMDPEYLLTLRLTMKSDVYSFGVVLFEVLCGRKVRDLRLDEEQWSLARWALSCIREGTLHRIIDPKLEWEILPDSLAEFVRIAEQCLSYRSKKRPTMTQVVASLEFALALQLGTGNSSTCEMDFFMTRRDHNVSKVHGYPKPPADEPKVEEKEAPKPEEKKVEPQVITVVLKLYMHCEDCAQQIKKRIQRMKGVESADPDLKSSQVTVKGVFDPPQLVEDVYKRTRKHAVIVNQEPENKKEDDKGRKGKEEKKVEPQVITVVLKVNMHCEGCAQELKKSLQRMKGVESAYPDLESSQVTVKGVFDPPQLVEYVYKRTGKHAVIVNQEPENKKEDDKGKEGKEEKKVEEPAADKKDGEDGGKAEEKKDGDRGEEAAAAAAKPEVAAYQEETNNKMMEMKAQRRRKAEEKKEGQKGKEEKKVEEPVADKRRRKAEEKKEEKNEGDSGEEVAADQEETNNEVMEMKAQRRRKAEEKKEEKKKGNGGEEAAAAAAKPEVAADQEETNDKLMEMKTEFWYMMMSPALFLSDENPNACSVM